MHTLKNIENIWLKSNRKLHFLAATQLFIEETYVFLILCISQVH